MAIKKTNKKKTCLPSCTTCLALHTRERFPQTFGSHYSSLGQCGQSHLNNPLHAVECRFKRLIKMRISGPTSEFDSLLSTKSRQSIAPREMLALTSTLILGCHTCRFVAKEGRWSSAAARWRRLTVCHTEQANCERRSRWRANSLTETRTLLHLRGGFVFPVWAASTVGGKRERKSSEAAFNLQRISLKESQVGESVKKKGGGGQMISVIGTLGLRFRWWM